MASTVEAPPALTPRRRALNRLIFNYRLAALTVTVLWLPTQTDSLGPVLGALSFAALWSWLPLRYWDRIGPGIMQHPAYLALDMFLGMGLLAVLGPQSPFVYFTLGTALLGGVLYGRRGALFFSVALLSLYWAGLLLRPGIDEAATFTVLVGGPALYPLAAAAGAAVARLVEQQAATESALRETERVMAVERERSRIAREMHDSLVKTIQGIALNASALPRWLSRDPARAAQEAGRLAHDAQAASAEARELLQDMRADALDVPLGKALEEYLESWSERTGVRVVCDADDASDISPDVRWELFSIAREALVNVERHSDAEKVRVSLRVTPSDLGLEVDDDGHGFEAPGDPASLRLSGHFGVLGMAERAKRVNGRLDLVSTPGGGTSVRVRVPLRELGDRGGRR